MIYILEEFNDGKWWTISAHTFKPSAAAALADALLDDPYGAFRIRDFELPKSSED